MERQVSQHDLQQIWIECQLIPSTAAQQFYINFDSRPLETQAPPQNQPFQDTNDKIRDVFQGQQQSQRFVAVGKNNAGNPSDKASQAASTNISDKAVEKFLERSRVAAEARKKRVDVVNNLSVVSRGVISNVASAPVATNNNQDLTIFSASIANKGTKKDNPASCARTPHVFVLKKPKLPVPVVNIQGIKQKSLVVGARTPETIVTSRDLNFNVDVLQSDALSVNPATATGSLNMEVNTSTLETEEDDDDDENVLSSIFCKSKPNQQMPKRTPELSAAESQNLESVKYTKLIHPTNHGFCSVGNSDLYPNVSMGDSGDSIRIENLNKLIFEQSPFAADHHFSVPSMFDIQQEDVVTIDNELVNLSMSCSTESFVDMDQLYQNNSEQVIFNSI